MKVSVGFVFRIVLIVGLLIVRATEAQESHPKPAQIGAAAAPQSNVSDGVRLSLTLQDAIRRARTNSVQFHAALTAAELAGEDVTQARSGLLPTVSYNNSALSTQSPGLAIKLKDKNVPPVVFIANNSVHEYVSQGTGHAALDMAAIANFRRTSAAAAVARAQVDIASRGLVVTVVQNYYSVLATQRKVEIAKKTVEEGDNFLKLTKTLESGGEVAHSDVIKAEIQMLDRRHQVQEAQLAALNARLDLAVLIFPNFNDNFELTGDLDAPISLPTLEQIQERAADSPDVKAALAAVVREKYDVLTARAGYLPSATGDYFYGIDAEHFAVSNLGYSYLGTLNIPVWNWMSTQSRVEQANLRRKQAEWELSLAQRKLVAQIQSFYAEAETALSELENLRRSVQLASDSLRLTKLRYSDGESKILEVVDAETTFYSTNFAYQDAAVRYQVALANLQTLTGMPPE